MITIKNDEEIQKLREAGKIVALAHQEVKKHIKPGITTKQLDQIVYKVITDNGATPSFLNYDGFPASICASINDQVVHGIPSDHELKDGDIISIDIGAKIHGYHGDSAWTYPVGKIDNVKQNLLEKTEEILFIGLDVIKEGIRLSDVSHAIEQKANEYKLGIVRELAGHGVGSELHEDPQILNYGPKGRGPILKAGMVLAIEPMLNAGTKRIKFHNDGWTVSTADKSPSAHFEHTIVVTKEGYEILTKL